MELTGQTHTDGKKNLLVSKSIFQGQSAILKKDITRNPFATSAALLFFCIFLSSHRKSEQCVHKRRAIEKRDIEVGVRESATIGCRLAAVNNVMREESRLRRTSEK